MTAGALGGRPFKRAIDPAVDAARLQAAVRGWRRRSRLIHLLRRALPASIACILLALVTAVVIRTLAPEVEPDRKIAIRILNPQFQGRDDKGRAFVMSGREAVRDPRDFQRITLTDPVLELQVDPARPPLRVTSRAGLYFEATRLISLSGDVRLTEPNGWNFRTEQALIDTRRDVISGRTRVQGVSPTQSVSADAFTIYNRGERVVLRGNVQSTVTN